MTSAPEIAEHRPPRRAASAAAAAAIVAVLAAAVVARVSSGDDPPRPTPAPTSPPPSPGTAFLTSGGGHGATSGPEGVGITLPVRSAWPRPVDIVAVTPLDQYGERAPHRLAAAVAPPGEREWFDPSFSPAPGPFRVAAGEEVVLLLKSGRRCPREILALRVNLLVDGRPAEQLVVLPDAAAKTIRDWCPPPGGPPL